MKTDIEVLTNAVWCIH